MEQVQTIAAPAERGYFTETQWPIYSAALVLPFLLIYQTGLVVLKSKVINGGDAIINILSHTLFRTVGVEVAFASMIVPICAFLIWQYRKPGPWTVQPQLLMATFFESLIYAVILYMMLGYFVHFIASSTVPASAPVAMASRSHSTGPRPELQDFVLFCGAGVYEELVFRVFLLGLLMLVFTKLFHMEHAHAAAWSTLTGAVIFSAFHHIGGEPFAINPFVQRILAGIYFSAIYFTRSFGVAAASHALYDIVVGLDQWKHG